MKHRYWYIKRFLIGLCLFPLIAISLHSKNSTQPQLYRHEKRLKRKQQIPCVEYCHYQRGPRGFRGRRGRRGFQGHPGISVTGTGYLFMYENGAQVLVRPDVLQNIRFHLGTITDNWTQENDGISYICKRSGIYYVEYGMTVESKIFDESSISIVAFIDEQEVPGSHSLTSVSHVHRPIFHSSSFLMNIKAGQRLKICVAPSDPGMLLVGSDAGRVKHSASIIILRIA